jgi:hypothetical protein
MEAGDIVYFWLGGSPDIRGIYGWGHILGSPYIKPDWDSYGVDVQFITRLRHHLTIEAIKNEPTLANMQILHMAVGSNFAINELEGRTLAKLMSPSERPRMVFP